MKKINGDAFAEIIRGKDGNIVNLKVLDPASIRVVTNRKGVIIRYDQLSKTGKKRRKARSEKRKNSIKRAKSP